VYARPVTAGCQIPAGAAAVGKSPGIQPDGPSLARLLPRRAALGQECLVARLHLNHLRATAQVVVDDVASADAAQPCPVAPRPTGCAIRAGHDIGADKIAAVSVNGRLRPRRWWRRVGDSLSKGGCTVTVSVSVTVEAVVCVVLPQAASSNAAAVNAVRLMCMDRRRAATGRVAVCCAKRGLRAVT